MSFSDRLRNIREQKGLKQKEMAELLAMPSNTYNGYETGKRSPSLETIEDISRVLKVDPNTLMGYKADTETLISEYLSLINMLDIKEIEIIKDFKKRGLSLVDVVNDLKILAEKYK